MRNILLKLKYLGTNYHGWQVQDNALSVQEELQNAVEKILGSREDIKGCSRTDAGVHANMYCCTLMTVSEISCFKLMGALNAKLPNDISVFECFDVSLDFHPRYSCTSKQYVYKIYNGTSRDPFYDGRALFYRIPLDVEKLDFEAKDFIGKHDFTSLCSIKSTKESNVRTVKNAFVTRDGDLVTFTVEADGFLYNMVRIMVGTLLFISEGKREMGSIPKIIDAKDRSAAGVTAPAYGLYLNQVFYGGENDGSEEKNI